MMMKNNSALGMLVLLLVGSAHAGLGDFIAKKKAEFEAWREKRSAASSQGTSSSDDFEESLLMQKTSNGQSLAEALGGGHVPVKTEAQFIAEEQAKMQQALSALDVEQVVVLSRFLIEKKAFVPVLIFATNEEARGLLLTFYAQALWKAVNESDLVTVTALVASNNKWYADFVLNRPAKGGMTLLHLAAANGNFAVAQELVRADIDPLIENAAHQLALELATEPRLKKLLSEHAMGVAVSLQDEDQAVAVIKMLIAKGVGVGPIGDNGQTPLHWAVNRGSVRIVYALVVAGADVRVATADGLSLSSQACLLRDENYWTLLHYAVFAKNADAVQVLLDAGADVLAKDKNDKTALDLARMIDNAKIELMLLDALKKTSRTDWMKAKARGWFK